MCVAVLALSIACSDDEGNVVENLPPVPVIVVIDQVEIGERVLLNGVGSLDPDGDALTYAWSFTSIPSGSNATIGNATQASANFTPDVEGIYAGTLSVSDGTATSEDTFTVIATPVDVGSIPTASITNMIGQEFSETNGNNIIRPGETLELFGTFSFDLEDGSNLPTYGWAVTTQPANSMVPADAFGTSFNFSGDLVGDYTIELTVTDSDGNTDTDAVVITIDRLPILLTENITSDMTLPNVYTDPQFVDYRVPEGEGFIFISANLTVEAGVVMDFGNDTGLNVQAAGSLNAEGTMTDSIVFRSQLGDIGLWAGIRVASRSSNNKFSYVQLSDGGSRGFDGAGRLANLELVEDARMEVSNSTIETSGGFGIFLRDVESELINFTDNRLLNNQTGPAAVLANHYQYFDGSSDYTGNSVDLIITHRSSTITSDATWQALNVPYRLANGVNFIQGEITIAPGAEFIGISGSGIQIDSEGSFNATGTAAAEIIFRGEQDLPGVWRGINFESRNTNNRLIWTQVLNGGERGFDGGNRKANVQLEDNSILVMQNSTLNNSADAGLWINSTIAELPDFQLNSMAQNEVPVRANPALWHFFDVDSDFSGNTEDLIDGDVAGSTITQTVTWAAISVPYRLPDRTIFISDGGVTIAAGAEITSLADGGIQTQENGFLTVAGTASNPVIMRGEQNVTGFWRGVRFNTNNANNIMTNVTISNGGSRGFDGANRKANIEIGSANGTALLTNVASNLSGGYGIRVQDGGSLNPSSSGLTFSGNVLSDIRDDN